MSTGQAQKRLLRSDARKRQVQLESLSRREVILDENGHAWQSDGYGLWYRAYDGDGISSYELAQLSGPSKVLEGK
ncbi:hypothetical protein [Arthrobacter russicus]|uniref:Uncharacterized protein n=1 Tax=Arthrobacter russicus TaxID=172040 RepID=A0ABU1JDU7_9MICC|nr:hypothetical protein [Arthrobacter russicus]MDR6270611.1 hypothetical protein [Arthrobacter russicus]